MAPRRPFWIELWRFPNSFSIWYWYARMQNTGLIPWKMWTWTRVNWKKQNGRRRPFWISWTWLRYLFSILSHKQPFCTILKRFEFFFFSDVSSSSKSPKWPPGGHFEFDHGSYHAYTALGIDIPVCKIRGWFQEKCGLERVSTEKTKWPPGGHFEFHEHDFGAYSAF